MGTESCKKTYPYGYTDINRWKGDERKRNGLNGIERDRKNMTT